MTNIVFLGCKKLKEIIVDKDNPSYCSFDGALFSKDMGRLIYVPGGKTKFTWPNNDFDTCGFTYKDCSKLKKLIVAQDHPKLCSINGVLYSKDGSELVRFPMGKETIEIPSHVTKIRYDAFSGCSNLTSIKIPSSVTEIGDRAFKGCTSLTELHIRRKEIAYNIDSFVDIGSTSLNFYMPRDSECIEHFKKYFKNIVEEE